MERRSFLKKMWNYAAGALFGILPIGWISSNGQKEILEIAPEKTRPVELAARYCSCPCKADYTKSQVHSHAWAKPQTPTTDKPIDKKPTDKKPTEPKSSDQKKKPPKQCTCACPAGTSSSGQRATQKSVVGTMEGRE